MAWVDGRVAAIAVEKAHRQIHFLVPHLEVALAGLGHLRGTVIGHWRAVAIAAVYQPLLNHVERVPQRRVGILAPLRSNDPRSDTESPPRVDSIESAEGFWLTCSKPMAVR